MCATCSIKCQTCLGPGSNACLSCFPTSNRTKSAVNPPYSCLCNTGYFDTGGRDCLKCFYTCLTCLTGDTIDKCTTCDSNNFRVATFGAGLEGTCACMKYYFEVLNNPVCQ